MDSLSAELALLDTTLAQTYNEIYHEVAGLALLVYDICLHFGSEVECIWKSPWSLPKVLYIIARYYAPLHLIQQGHNILCVDYRDISVANNILSSDLKSSVDVQLQPSAACILTTEAVAAPKYGWTACPVVFSTVINIILILRMHAIYDRSTKVLIFMCVMMFIEFVGELSAGLETSLTVVTVAIPIPWPGCIVDNGDLRRTLVAWVPSILVGFICVSMTLYKYVRLAGMLHRRPGRQITPLFFSFVWDDLYRLFAADLFATLMILLVHNPIARIGLSWLVVAYSIAGTRMLLNLRMEARKNLSIVSGVTARSTAPIQVNSSERRSVRNPNPLALDESPWYNARYAVAMHAEYRMRVKKMG
ncbi:hypothetical protein NM688_g7286 [Phlebia brevispora]|uniref:Uncharacterized protein n=1 Tax=Phlebia brevispora TaxID=194682 RepID=A0ACC1S7H6_9APHY|nr:hypothetical protein NM688_g7286 [Phlebia brevispora]